MFVVVINVWLFFFLGVSSDSERWPVADVFPNIHSSRKDAWKWKCSVVLRKFKTHGSIFPTWGNVKKPLTSIIDVSPIVRNSAKENAHKFIESCFNETIGGRRGSVRSDVIPPIRQEGAQERKELVLWSGLFAVLILGTLLFPHTHAPCCCCRLPPDHCSSPPDWKKEVAATFKSHGIQTSPFIHSGLFPLLFGSSTMRGGNFSTFLRRCYF